MNRSVFHPCKTLLFSFLSCADLYCTWRLIEGSGHFYESNPVADAWLASYGWRGLAFFKFAAAILVVATSIFISLQKPRVGGRILAFACAALVIVVLYSCFLLGISTNPSLFMPAAVVPSHRVAGPR